MTIIGEVKNILRDYSKKCREIKSEIEKRESDIKNGKYSRSYVDNTIRPQIDALREKLRYTKEEAARAVHDITAKYAEEARRLDDLNPADMTDDCKLLNVGVKLNADDLKAIVSRNPNNRTMLQLVLRYADEHGVKTGLQYNGSRSAIETAKNLDITTDRYFMNWIDAPDAENVLNKMIPSEDGE